MPKKIRLQKRSLREAVLHVYISARGMAGCRQTLGCVLKCVTVCCSVLQCAAECCRVLQGVVVIVVSCQRAFASGKKQKKSTKPDRDFQKIEDLLPEHVRSTQKSKVFSIDRFLEYVLVRIRGHSQREGVIAPLGDFEPFRMAETRNLKCSHGDLNDTYLRLYGSLWP